MTCLSRIVLTSPLTVAQFKSICDLSPGQLPALQNFENYIGALSGGNESGILDFLVGALKAAGTITFSSTGPTNGQTCTICGVTFTAATSATNPNEFTRSDTPSVNATNLAAAINESEDLAGIVTAEALAAAVTVTCVVPGLIGNGLVMANVNLSNTVFVSFAGGDDGTSNELDFE